MMFYKPAHSKNKITTKFLLLGTLFVIIMSMANSCTYNKLSPPAGTCGAMDTVNVSYANQVAPIIVSNCFTSLSCHNGANPYSGYHLDGYANLTAFLASTQPHEGKDNFIGSIEHIAPHPVMPQTGSKISDCDISKLVNWINEGEKNN